MKSLSRRRLLGAATTTAVLLAGCSSDGSDGGGHLYAANNTDDSHRLALSVTESSSEGQSVVDGIYRIPPRTSLQFEGVFESGSQYRLRARQPDVVETGDATLGIQVDTCDPDQEMAVEILAGNNGPDIITYGCGEPFERSDGFEYVDPADHRIGTVTGTISTATPS